VPKQIAEWNTELKLWTNSKGNQLLELWEPFLATWPKSGMTQNGLAFELPTLEQRTNDSESLSSPILRTPAASEAERGHQTESVARARGGQVTLSGQMKELFPTPIVSDWKNGISSPGYGMNLPMTAKSLLPTTRVSMANGPTQKEIKEGNPKSRIEVEVMLFPTPNTMEHREIKTPEQIQAMKDKSPGGYRNLRESVVNEMPETNWGKFEAAIRRWQEVIGRPAPAPTKPDGKDNGHRLSSLFTEWLMGLPEGWITGLGLKRNDELKLAGNGVVPQQAELALRILLEDDNLLERIKK
jgi:DNA (cytosine-5)-methyltransferase 1